MNRLEKLTVRDLMSHPSFQDAKLVAGALGLHRPVRWIHVLEIMAVGDLLSGNEVILSTGVGWSQSNDSICSFLEQLIDNQVSALCVELGAYIKELPDLMVEIANSHAFPLIVFSKEVRFIDITQSINTMVMETQFKMMSDLEAYSNKLNHLLLSSGAFKAILRLLHQYLNVQVIYKPFQGELITYPSLQDQRLTRLLALNDVSKIKSCFEESISILHQPIEAIGQTFAELIIMGESPEWSEFDSLVLDRTATALSQDQLRSLYVEQRRRSQEHQWVLNWLNGTYLEEEIEANLRDIPGSVIQDGCLVFICKIVEEGHEPDLTYYSMVLTGLFEKIGFISLNTFDRNTIIYILFDQRKFKNWKQRCELAITQIRSSKLIIERQAKLNFAIGRRSNHLKVDSSYTKAREVLLFQEKFKDLPCIFYEELYIYRILARMDRQELKDFIEDYIGDLLKNDSQDKDALIQTLKVLLEVNGVKKEAAEKLHVVRQTLYHRIERIGNLLGDPFENPDKRLAIEVAVHAWEYLKNRQ